MFDCQRIYIYTVSGKQSQKTMEHHHAYSWVVINYFNSHFQVRKLLIFHHGDFLGWTQNISSELLHRHIVNRYFNPKFVIVASEFGVEDCEKHCWMTCLIWTFNDPFTYCFDMFWPVFLVTSQPVATSLKKGWDLDLGNFSKMVLTSFILFYFRPWCMIIISDDVLLPQCHSWWLDAHLQRTFFAHHGSWNQCSSSVGSGGVSLGSLGKSLVKRPTLLAKSRFLSVRAARFDHHFCW